MDPDKETTKKEPVINRPKSSKVPALPAARPYNSWKFSPIITTVLILLISFFGGWLGARSYSHSAPSSSTSVKYISSESQVISKIAKDVGQSVVSVNVQAQVSAQDFFGFAIPTSQSAAGTGVIISTDGTILTNRHVVPAGTTSVNVTLADGTKFTNVKVLGRTNASSSLDVAFLKIEDLKGKKLVAATLGDSSKVQVGDKVVAIGNALGQFQNTVTAGIISGYGREVTATDATGTSAENLSDLFQTDAAINEGNSGGPLVNVNGEVIGINTAVAGGAQNIGFSIPINDTKGLISSVLKNGTFKQPYLGVRYVSLTPDIAYQYNLSVNRGAYIAPSTDGQPPVLAGSPAEKAGLKEKDVITKVNDIAIDERTNLSGALANFNVGDSVTLTIFRYGKTMTVKASLAEAPTN